MSQSFPIEREVHYHELHQQQEEGEGYTLERMVLDDRFSFLIRKLRGQELVREGIGMEKKRDESLGF